MSTPVKLSALLAQTAQAITDEREALTATIQTVLASREDAPSDLATAAHRVLHGPRSGAGLAYLRLVDDTTTPQTEKTR